MSDKYKMRENEKAYFVTLTVVDWLDVFTRKNSQLTSICNAWNINKLRSDSF
jgi:hypothetical protein